MIRYSRRWKKGEKDEDKNSNLTFEIKHNNLYMYLIGEVDEDMEHIIHSALDKFEDRFNPESRPFEDGHVQILISSYGGLAHSGFSVYDRLRRCPIPITIIATGKIMSAGILICSAADCLLADPGTEFMHHKVSTTIEGTIDVIETELKAMKKIQENFIKALTRKGTWSKRKWSSVARNKDFFFTAHEARNIGFVDDVIDQPEDVEMEEPSDENEGEQV